MEEKLAEGFAVKPKGMPQLGEIEELSYGVSSPEGDSRLIQGENLAALIALESEFAGRIRCVYLDPPYNTGNTFEHYADGRERAEWLAMMKERLVVIARLLHEDGLLAVQIDDNEYAWLYLLMVQLFGEANLKTVVVKMSEASGVKMGPVKTGGILPKLKEYIILAKGKGVRNLRLTPIPKSGWDREYNLYLDNFSREDRQAIDAVSAKEEKTSADLAQVDAILKGVRLVTVAERLKALGIGSEEQLAWRNDNAWRIVRTAASTSVHRLAEKKKPLIGQVLFSVLSPRDEVLYLVKSDYRAASRKPRVQLLFADTNLFIHPGDIWTDIKTTGLEVEGGVSFKNGKKPEALLHRIIAMATEPGDWVLDAFAGSGTTGAVAHKLGRPWIMIEAGDHCRTHIAPRMKRIIDGDDQKGISEAVGWKGGGGYRFFRLEDGENQ